MGQLTQTTTELQAIVDNSDAANVGKTSLTDGSDTTAVAFKKSGFYSLQGSSSNAPSTDRAVLISAIRDTAATGEIRYGQIAITESNGLWWNRDDGGSLGTWYEAVSTTGTQTLTNKTLTSPVLTTPQINDSAADHQYIFAGSNLVADRTITLPLLTGDDTFVFEAHTQTLTNKTLTSPVFNTGVSGTAVLDADDFTGASATTLATSESIKAYVDSQVGSFDTLSEVLAAGNTTGSTDIEVTAAQKVQFRDAAIYINSSADGQLDIVADTIDIDGAINASGEIIAASLDISGDIDVDGTTNLDVVDIDGAVDMASTLGVTGVATLASLVATTADINAGTIDGTVIGGAVAAAISGTTGQFATSLNVDGSITADGLTVSAPSGDTPASIVTTTAGSFLQFTDVNTTAGRSPLVGAITDGLAFYTSAGSYSQKMTLTANGDISFYEDTGTTPKFFWDASAESLGIGTSSPRTLLHVTGLTGDDDPALGSSAAPVFISNTANSYGLNIGVNSAGAGWLQAQSNTTSTAYDLLLNPLGGNVLVGTSSATGSGASSGKQVIGFNGAAENGLYFDDTRTAAGTDIAIIFGRGATSTGSITTTLTTTAYVTSSDQRLKENITDANDAGDKIDAIKVRQYDWKVDGSHQDYGMVAQELMTVAPEAVSAPEDPEEMMGVDYSKLVPMMLKEIQSLRARIAQLES